MKHFIALALGIAPTLAALVRPNEDHKDCFTGVTFEGNATGKIEQIGGIDTYVARAHKPRNRRTALIYVSDVFGIPLINNKLLIDDFARNGWDTYAPDYLQNQVVNTTQYDAPGYNMTAYLENHDMDVSLPPLVTVIRTLREKGYKEFMAIGFCFGGMYAAILAQHNLVKTVVSNHPSFLIWPDDFTKMIEFSKAPWMLNLARVDMRFPQEAIDMADRMLANGKYRPGFKQVIFDNVRHGFTSRGNLTDPTTRAAKEQAFKNAVEWFQQHDGA